MKSPLSKMLLSFLITILFFLTETASAQLYRSSVVGTEFDYITETDPSTFMCLEFKGKGFREMPDKANSGPLIQEAFIFVSYYSDGTSIDMAIDIDFKTKNNARKEALRYTPRLGKLPTSLRSGVKRLVVHKGNEDVTAFADQGLIILYSANATKRISTHDLEETIFHESVHASWDNQYRESSAWLAAQKSDGEFITRYAKNNAREDLAESALFAYTLIHHPKRIPSAEANKIKKAIPARIAFIETLLPKNKSVFYKVGAKYKCDGSGTTFTVSGERSKKSIEEFEKKKKARSKCNVDISTVGGVSDILSNALNIGLEQDESKVRSFLDGANEKYSNVGDLLKATTDKFGFDKATLEAEIQKYLHCNCKHD